MISVLGLDLSLTSTGWAEIFEGRVSVGRITSKACGDGLLARNVRLDKIVDHFGSLGADADLVVIEGPSFGQQRQGGTHDRAGLWWRVVDAYLSQGLDVVEVPPATVKVYATGKGNASKDQVLAAVVRRYADVDVTGNDDADALVLAALGARHLGEPIDDVPVGHLKALDKVRWPA